jgi:alpha-galactosidase
MIGTDVQMSGTKYYPPLLTAATLNTLTNAEVIAVDQDALGAVGRPVAGSTAVYAKPLGNFASGQYAVMILNRSSSSNSFSVNWGDLGLASGSAATVRDLWAHQNLGSFTNNYTSPILAPHGSMMLVVTGSFDWNRPRVYEAESGFNTVGGTAYYIPNNSSFSSGAYVTGIGMGTLRRYFNNA